MEELFEIPIEILNGYKITKTGKIWSCKSNKFLSPKIVNGYFGIHLRNNDYLVHLLVANTFLKPVNGKPFINHIDENKENNNVENLEWVTQKENVAKHSKITSHERKVKCIDPITLEIIDMFDSVKTAAESIGKSRRAIQLCLSGQNNTAGGFKWEYENESHKKDNIDISKGCCIYNYEAYYVFPDGKIYNTLNKKILSPVVNASGKCYVTLCKDKKKQNCYVHRIVADHYLQNKPSDKSIVEHINGILQDNDVKNLKWSTTQQPNIKVLPTNN